MSNQFGFGDMIQKAFYFGVGLADYAQEQATEKLNQLREQSQKLADEMVKRGEMNSEQARKFVEELMAEAQRGQQMSTDSTETGEPRRIEIIEEDEQDSQPSSSSSETAGEDVDNLRQQVDALREELKRLQKN